jgi:hypothetical protein
MRFGFFDVGVTRSLQEREFRFVTPEFGIEVKAKETIASSNLKSLNALAEENKLTRYLCVCLATRRRQAGKVTILPYCEFLDSLWGGLFS